MYARARPPLFSRKFRFNLERSRRLRRLIAFAFAFVPDKHDMTLAWLLTFCLGFQEPCPVRYETGTSAASTVLTSVTWDDSGSIVVPSSWQKNATVLYRATVSCYCIMNERVSFREAKTSRRGEKEKNAAASHNSSTMYVAVEPPHKATPSGSL